MSALALILSCVGEPAGPPERAVLLALDPGADSILRGVPGERFPVRLRFRVLDATGAPISGAPIGWKLEGRNAAVESADAASDADGVFGLEWRFGTDAAERQGLVVFAGTPNRLARRDLTGLAVPAVLERLSVAAETIHARVGLPVPLAVSAQDPYGNDFVPSDLTFESLDTTIAHITAAAELVADRRGLVRVVARAEHFADSMWVSVTQTVDSIRLPSNTVHFHSLGQVRELRVDFVDDLGHIVRDTAPDVSLIGSPAVEVLVASPLVLKSRTPGVSGVLLRVGDVSRQLDVNVTQEARSLELPVRAVAFDALTDTVRVAGIVRDSLGAVIEDRLAAYESLNPRVAAVDAMGLISAIGNGRTAVVVRSAGLSDTVDVQVLQRVTQVRLGRDTLAFDALEALLPVGAVAEDRLGTAVAGAPVSYTVSDAAVVSVRSAGIARALANGSATITATADSAHAVATVVVRQVPVTVDVSPIPGDSILRPAEGELLEVDCRGVDANGFPVPKSFVAATSRHGIVQGSDCASLRARRSGVDTVVLSAGADTAELTVRVAIQPVVDSPAGRFLEVSDLPAGSPWAPSTRVLPDGRIEVYYANYVYDVAADLDRANLNRLISVDSLRFEFDGIAVAHGDSLDSEDGRGIENVAVFPDARGQGWRMLYAGGNEVWGWQVFGAVSADGRSWVKTGLTIGNGYPGPVRPVGEGMAVDRSVDGAWRLVMGAYEPSPSTVNAWEITEWRSHDQVEWRYIRTLVTSTTMPLPGRCAVYSPSVTQIGPSMWRLVFAAHSYCGSAPSAAIYSAVSSDFVRWQFEGRLLGRSGTSLFYSAAAGQRMFFVRRDDGQPARLAAATIIMR